MSEAKLRTLMAGAMAMIGPEVLKVIDLNEPRAEASPKRPQRYLGMTDEQRAWNKAVDERKARKRRAAMPEGGEHGPV